MKIGDWVKQYRTEHGLSMQAFGDMCNLSRAYISILEKGINPTTKKPFSPTIQTIKKIAEVTGVSFDDLLHLLDKDQSIIVNSVSDAADDLTEDEKHLVEDYRKLTDDEKREVKNMIAFKLQLQIEKNQDIQNEVG